MHHRLKKYVHFTLHIDRKKWTRLNRHDTHYINRPMPRAAPNCHRTAAITKSSKITKLPQCTPPMMDQTIFRDNRAALKCRSTGTKNYSIHHQKRTPKQPYDHRKLHDYRHPTTTERDTRHKWVNPSTPSGKSTATG